MEPKQVIVVRTDLNMRKGKIGGQAGHGVLNVLLDQAQVLRGADHPELGATGDDWIAIPLTPPIRAWLDGDRTKIVLGVGSEAELVAIHDKAKAAGLKAHMVTDLGKTEFAGVKTRTAVAIGPEPPERFVGITDHLKPL